MNPLFVTRARIVCFDNDNQAFIPELWANEGLAILQHPSNLWYPSPWFTRDYGFFSPTPMYWPENGTETFFKKGDVLRLLYRVLVHGGSAEEAKIGELFDIYKIVKL